MRTLNCVIIEDQIAAQRILQGYIENVPNLELVGTFIQPTKALLALEELSVDILFLDIQLPKVSGIDFLKSLKSKPHIILTTAFSEYAVEGFELDVVDYLLKPFSFERFLKSISKVGRVLETNSTVFDESHVFVKVKGVLQKVRIADILLVESKGDFSVIRTKNQGLVANISLREAVSTLGNSFLRCHKSYVVNTNSIERIIGNSIQLANHTIPIGRTYKDEVLRYINLI